MSSGALIRKWYFYCRQLAHGIWTVKHIWREDCGSMGWIGGNPVLISAVQSFAPNMFPSLQVKRKLCKKKNITGVLFSILWWNIALPCTMGKCHCSANGSNQIYTESMFHYNEKLYFWVLLEIAVDSSYKPTCQGPWIVSIYPGVHIDLLLLAAE